MSLADDLAAAEQQHVHHNAGCAVGRALEEHVADDPEAVGLLLAALHNPKITDRDVADAAARHGYCEVGVHTWGAHRRGDCECAAIGLPVSADDPRLQ